MSYLKKPQIFQNTKLSAKKKSLNLGTKMPYLGIFGVEFENNTVIFETNTFEFIYLQNFAKKRSTFGTKNALFRYFWVAI